MLNVISAALQKSKYHMKRQAQMLLQFPISARAIRKSSNFIKKRNPPEFQVDLLYSQ
jgi:hypothetical protein